MTALEDALPGYDFQVRHSRWIAAEPAAVWRALSTLTLDDLWVTRPLVAIRHLGRTAGNGGRRLFTDGPVRMFVLDPPRYALGGTVDRPWQLRPDRIAVTSLQQFMDFDEPGWVAFLTDFTLEVRGTACSSPPRRAGVAPTAGRGGSLRPIGRSSGYRAG